MPDQPIRLTFEPEQRTAHILKDTKIIEASARAGLTINTPCGGAGTCGKCRVQMTTGAVPPGPCDRAHFSDVELSQGWRLACQTAVQAHSNVSVPDTSRLTGQHKIITDTKTTGAAALSPTVRKIYVELPLPTLEDNTPDLLRLEQAIGPFTPHASVLPNISKQLRECDFKGTAVVSGDRLIDFEPGDTTAQCFGMAFDIGTTTLVGLLLDLTDGKELAVTSRLNPQVSFGDDVLSRIQYACADEDALSTLHDAVLQAIRKMITDLCAQANISAQHVYDITMAGNTTMEHLLCQMDPTPLGQIPFVPTFGRGVALPSQCLNLPMNPQGSLLVFPVIGGFVGGDTVACVLATDLARTSDSVLMIDVGTNGEIVLAHNGQLWAASTAAGPAFEGARILCGMRASTGAIEKVLLQDDVHVSVIGQVDPVGICGSGLIDGVAELLNRGMISTTGKLLGPQDLPVDLPEALKQRVRVDAQGHTEFLLWPANWPDKGSSVVLTERDVREVQLAIGAIRAGITILLKHARVAPGTLSRVLIAGGFGSFIRRNHAQRIGLLPSQVDHHKINHVGNASLAGARLALLSSDAREQSDRLARETQHIELSVNTNFQTEFAEAMIFPD